MSFYKVRLAGLQIFMMGSSWRNRITSESRDGYAFHFSPPNPRKAKRGLFFASADALIDGQYADRQQLRPILDAIIDAAAGLGEVIIQTRKTYDKPMTRTADPVARAAGR